MSDMYSPNGRRHWHLEKSVSVGHIVSTLAVALAGVAFIWGIKLDVARNEIAIRQARRESSWINARIETGEKRVRDDIAEIKAALRRIEDKLDRKADKR